MELFLKYPFWNIIVTKIMNSEFDWEFGCDALDLVEYEIAERKKNMYMEMERKKEKEEELKKAIKEEELKNAIKEEELKNAIKEENDRITRENRFKEMMLQEDRKEWLELLDYLESK